MLSVRRFGDSDGGTCILYSARPSRTHAETLDLQPAFARCTLRTCCGMVLGILEQVQEGLCCLRTQAM